MSLQTPEAIRMLQRKLYRKAKQEPHYRFYLLYDKIYREDLLSHAYALAKRMTGHRGWMVRALRKLKRRERNSGCVASEKSCVPRAIGLSRYGE
jgi:hypothetical protein